jgi:putative endonuclease
MGSNDYCVYILASRWHGALYIGITNDLPARVFQHRAGQGSKHAARYQISRLVYFEHFQDVREAIAREKRLKRWHRQWKIELIESVNRNWDDLYDTLSI